MVNMNFVLDADSTGLITNGVVALCAIGAPPYVAHTTVIIVLQQIDSIY